MATNILIVEDNPDFQKLLQTVLESEDYAVTVTDNSIDALLRANASAPSLILTDVDLGGASGITLCQQLKAAPSTASIPVVLLSGSHVDEGHQLQGLEEGADDYLLKPISNELLVAKVKAVLRRYASPEELREVLKAEGLALDVGSRKVSVGDREVALTRKEFDLLTAFLRKKGQVVYTAHLFRSVWGYGAAVDIDSHTVKVHVSSLRSKLGHELGQKIVSVPGLGYRFESG